MIKLQEQHQPRLSCIPADDFFQLSEGLPFLGGFRELDHIKTPDGRFHRRHDRLKRLRGCHAKRSISTLLIGISLLLSRALRSSPKDNPGDGAAPSPYPQSRASRKLHSRTRALELMPPSSSTVYRISMGLQQTSQSSMYVWRRTDVSSTIEILFQQYGQVKKYSMGCG